jgi:hypothetical protein
VRIKRIGNYWIKEVNPNASRLAQWWGRGSLNAQARGFARLGDMAPSYIYKNGKLITRHIGQFSSSGRVFWRTWAKASWRLRTPFNDVRPRNMGATGQVFDPTLHPIQQGLYWMGSGILAALGGAYGYYYFSTPDE